MNWTMMMNGVVGDRRMSAGHGGRMAVTWTNVCTNDVGHCCSSVWPWWTICVGCPNGSGIAVGWSVVAGLVNDGYCVHLLCGMLSGNTSGSEAFSSDFNIDYNDPNAVKTRLVFV